MLRRPLPFALLAALLLGAQQPDVVPQPLEQLTLDLARLAAHPRLDYDVRVTRDGAERALGHVLLETRVDGERVALRDRIELESGSAAFWQDVRTEGPLAGLLRPATARIQGTTDEPAAEEFTLEVLFDAAGARFADRGRPRALPLPADTVTFSALLRLLPLLPDAPGGVLVGHLLELDELRLLGPCRVTRGADDDVPLDGQAVRTRRFDVERSPEEGGGVFLSAWIDDAGRPVRLLLDGRKLLVLRTR